jgi:hypothetical protein
MINFIIFNFMQKSEYGTRIIAQDYSKLDPWSKSPGPAFSTNSALFRQKDVAESLAFQRRRPKNLQDFLMANPFWPPPWCPACIFQ